MTDLPIDFQVDRQTEANEDHGEEPRSAIGITLATGIAYEQEDAINKAEGK